MDPRMLQLIQRGLVGAVTVVLALVVITAFVRALQTSEETATPRPTTSTTTSTTQPEEASTTTAAPEATTTTDGVVVPAVCNQDSPGGNGVTVLRVYYPCGPNALATGEAWVYRAVPPTDLVLTTTLTEMTNGLNETEAELGFRSPFPDSAPGSFLGVSLSQGTAFVEFSLDIFPDGVDTPEGAQVFLSTLNANVFQFDTINRVEYRLSGSCDAFWQQLGGNCEVVARSDWRSSLPSAG